MEAPTSAIPLPYLPIDTPPSPGLDLNASLQPRIIGVSGFLFAISFIVVGLRFLARYLSTAGIWWDDWTCLAAMIVAWGTCIICFLTPQYNFGQHEAAIGLTNAISDTESFFKLLYAYETLYTIAITLAKFSIILFYMRIFTERPFRVGLYVLSGFITMWYVAIQITQLVQCRPIHALWDGTYADHCIDILGFFFGAGISNCIFNFVLLVMPLPMIWGLEIKIGAKLGLMATFLLGTFVFAVSVARLVFLKRIQNVDVTWTYVDAAIWTTVEPNIAVCSASLPILRSLWILLRPRSSIQKRHDRDYYHHHQRSGNKSALEKQVVFSSSEMPHSLEDPDPEASFHHHGSPMNRTGRSMPVGSGLPYDGNGNGNGNSNSNSNGNGNGNVYDGYDDRRGTAGLLAAGGGGISRKGTVRSEDSTAPLTAASELSAHKSLPYGGGGYERYTAHVSAGGDTSRNDSRNDSRHVLTEKPSVISRIIGGAGSSVAGSSSSVRSPRLDVGDEISPVSIEMRKLPIQGATSESGGRERGHERNQESGSLNGYPPVAELYA